MPEYGTKRIDYIDVAKGIGILLVVLGHNYFYLVSPFFYKLIYAFHMPLFFFTAGMFFRPGQSFMDLLRRRAGTLLLPYLVTILMIFIMTITYTKTNVNVAGIHLLKALYTNGYYLEWAPLWFLPHLFLLNLYAYGFYWVVDRSRLPWMKWALMTVLLLAGVSTISKFWPFTPAVFGREFSVYGLPFSLDLALVSGTFFLLGCELNKFPLEKFISRPILTIGSGLALLAMVTFLPQESNFNQRVFSSAPVNTLEALLGIFFILGLSKQAERLPALSSGLRYIGQASLIILIFHLPIQQSWSTKAEFLFNNQPFIYWTGYAAGVLLPLFFHRYLIMPNPVVRKWFGLRAPAMTQD